MPFDRPSILTIKDRIEKGIEVRLFGKVALLRNAVLRVLARVFAGAIHGNYGYISYIVKSVLFVTSAEGGFLDNPHGRMWGIPRRPGSFASGDAIFTGSNGTVIPVDTRIQNEDGVEYGTTVIGTISGGSATIAIQAVESGEDGNFSGSSLQMISPISGIDDEVTASGAITGGEDTEDDETYRARILQRIQNIPAGGSAADYVRWATEYPGVARAWCYPLASGPGTVSTVITASGSDPVPSSQLLSDVQGYIAVRKPVTADHSTESITNIFNNPGKAELDIYISITPLDADVQNNIENNLRTLFLPHKPGTSIPISQIRAAISNSGVTDYQITVIEIDGVLFTNDNDIVLSGYQYPWLNSVIFQELT